MRYEGIRTKIFRVLKNIFKRIKRRVFGKVEFIGVVTCRLFDLDGKLIEEKVYKNLVTTVVKNNFAQLLNPALSPTFTGTINYAAVGTDAASPAITDTQLGAEVGRVVHDDANTAGSVTTINFYFDPLTGNGNLKEFGAFIDGTATINTGILFDRVNIDVAKTSLTSLQISLEVTVA